MQMNRDEQVMKVFLPAAFVSFRSTINLKSCSVRSKIYSLERKVGTDKFISKRCLVFTIINIAIIIAIILIIIVVIIIISI